MKTLCGMAVVGLVLFVATGALAGEEATRGLMDGNALLVGCAEMLRFLDTPGVTASAHQSLQAGICWGQVGGVLYLDATYKLTLLPTQRLFCAPGAILWVQGVRIVLRYLQTHPELLHYEGSALIIRAMQDAFPCPSSPARPRK